MVFWHLREALGRDTDGSRDEELVFDTLPVVLYGELAYVALALLRLGGRDLDALHVLEWRDSVVDDFCGWFPGIEVEARSRQRRLDDVSVRFLHLGEMLPQYGPRLFTFCVGYGRPLRASPIIFLDVGHRN